MADHFVTRQNFMPDTAQQIRKKFLEGVKILKNTPSGKSTKDFDIPALNGVDSPVSRYDLFVIWHHRTMHHLVPPNNTDQRYAAHSGPLFLPWHRIMLLAFEYNLQVALGDAEFALPYWDWAADGSMHLRDSRQARTDHASQRPARTGRVTAETKRRGNRREGHRFRRSQVQRRIDRFSAQPRSEPTQPGPHLGGRRHGTVLVAERSGVLPAPLQRRPDLGRRSPVNSPTCSAGTSYSCVCIHARAPNRRRATAVTGQHSHPGNPRHDQGLPLRQLPQHRQQARQSGHRPTERRDRGVSPTNSEA